MVSGIAWMDTSDEEQRRMREMIKLFEQPESRDELGLGQIRDSLSNLLFPGTSVVQTRARYFVLIPWCYQEAARRGRSTDASAKARQLELELIVLLAEGSDRRVIGRRSGVALNRLPSSIYWSGLVRYGILTREASPEQLTGVISSAEDTDELAVRHREDWHPTIPNRTDGFPKSLDDGTGLKALDLRLNEAEWLSERIIDACPDTLLAHLVQSRRALSPTSQAPWEDLACVDLPPGPARVLQHAQAFSLVAHGASILYNALVAEAYERARFDRDTDLISQHPASYCIRIGSRRSIRARA